MENYTLALITSLFSGIIATAVTLWWQNKSEKIKLKTEIFTTLMAYRFNLAHAESVKALNCVQAVFYDNKNVQEAWAKFKQMVSKQPYIQQEAIDAHISLLEEISKDLKYKNIEWKKIKNYYYPQSLVQEDEENVMIRKAQAQMAMSDIRNDKSI
ncbi:MAG: hypothetical protein E7406_04350 [Ruminococcaceae bacterium]|nr:hypothetical protein [Oscillospiraceae bacterium]